MRPKNLVKHYLGLLKQEAASLFKPGYSPLRYNRMLREATPRTRFSRIYKEGLWLNQLNPKESLSGSGSTLASTETFRAGLEVFLRNWPAGVLFDAPCGDFNYMRHVNLPGGWRYIGGDIVPELVTSLRKTYPDHTFLTLDITSDPFPECDLWLCRDCLFHLSFEDAKKALLNFTRSSVMHALITTHLNVTENRDITTGDFREIDLTLPPFSLPAPKQSIEDVPSCGTRRIVGLWSKEEIATALKA